MCVCVYKALICLCSVSSAVFLTDGLSSILTLSLPHRLKQIDVEFMKQLHEKVTPPLTSVHKSVYCN